jgi:hypothetical protein
LDAHIGEIHIRQLGVLQVQTSVKDAPRNFTLVNLASARSTPSNSA